MSTGYYTEGKVVDGVNTGGGTFVEGTPPVITPKGLTGSTTPYVVPPSSPSIPAAAPTVTNPPGTTVDDLGNIVPTSVSTPTDGAPPNKLAALFSKIGGLNDLLATKGDVTKQLQDQNQLGIKTEAAAKSYNAYQQAKNDAAMRQQTIGSNPTGMTAAGVSEVASDTQRLDNMNLSNLAIVANADQGLLEASQKNIQDKLDAQFKPIQEQIDNQEKFLQLNQNDLTDSEKAQMQEKIDKTKTDSSNVQSTADDLHKTLLANNAPTSVYSQMDKVNNNFIAGKINAAQAQDQLYSIAAPYGVNKTEELYKKAQLDKLNADIAKTNAETKGLGTVPTITNPSAAPYSAALSVILGSSKFTKEQKQSVIDAINSGQDPLSVIKNNAKNIMGQTEASKLTNYETAKSQMNDLNGLLSQYYQNGGNTGILSGTYESTINKLGQVNDPKLVGIATQIATALQIYRNAVTGTAYSVQEGKSIESIFPGINKTEGLNKAIIDGRLNAFDSTIDGMYKSTLGEKTYNDLKNIQTKQTTAPIVDTVTKSATVGGQKYTFPTIDDMNNFLKAAGYK